MLLASGEIFLPSFNVKPSLEEIESVRVDIPDEAYYYSPQASFFIIIDKQVR